MNLLWLIPAAFSMTVAINLSHLPRKNKNEALAIFFGCMMAVMGSFCFVLAATL